MRAQEELEEPQEAVFATTFPTEHEFGLKNRSVPPTPTPILRGWTRVALSFESSSSSSP